MPRVVTPPIDQPPVDQGIDRTVPNREAAGSSPAGRARLKLPAYAKALLLERRAGRHPRVITLVYGHEWRGVAEPKICIKPEGYAPGVYDWSVVAGCKVELHDQVMGAAEATPCDRPTTWGKFFDLLGELADAGAHVEVQWPQASRWPSMSAAMMALSCKRGRHWPRWWSDARHARSDAACIAWLEDGLTVLKRRDHEQGECAGAA